MKFGKSIKSSFLVYPTCLLTFTKSSNSTCLFGPPYFRNFHKISILLVFLKTESTIVKIQKWFQPNVCIKALLMQAMFIFDPFFQTTNKILDCCFVNKYRLSQKNCKKNKNWMPSITDGVHRNENFVEIIPVFSTFSNFFKKKKNIYI